MMRFSFTAFKSCHVHFYVKTRFAGCRIPGYAKTGLMTFRYMKWSIAYPFLFPMPVFRSVSETLFFCM